MLQTVGSERRYKVQNKYINIDGTIFNEDTTVEYPFPLLVEQDITNSPEWNTPEQEII